MLSANLCVTPDGRVRRADAAVYLGISPKTLSNYACRGLGPRPIKIAGRVFYYLSDLAAFVRGEA